MATPDNPTPRPTKPVQNTMKRRSLADRVSRVLWSAFDTVMSNRLKFGLATTAAILLALFFIGLSILAPSSPGREIRFSDATGLISASGAVQKAELLDQDARLELTTSSGVQVWTAYPHADPYTSQLLTLLLQHKIPTTVDPQSGKPTLRAVVQFLLPILILACLFVLLTLMAREQGGAIAAFSKWTGRKQKAGSGTFTFNDVAGAPEALVELREMVDYLENPMRYAELGARAP